MPILPTILLTRPRSSAAWTPGDLSGLAATLLPAESRSRGLLWQNAAKTVAAVADGDPVRVAVCPYTAVEFTAPSDAARPLLYSEGGGLWSLEFDGVDDYLDVPSISLTSSCTVCAGFTPTNVPSDNLHYVLGGSAQGIAYAGSVLKDLIFDGSVYRETDATTVSGTSYVITWRQQAIYRGSPPVETGYTTASTPGALTVSRVGRRVDISSVRLGGRVSALVPVASDIGSNNRELLAAFVSGLTP